MAVNIKAGWLSLVIAKQSVPVSATGITPANVAMIYLCEGNPFPSHNPANGLNEFDQVIAGKPYLIRGKVDQDNPYFAIIDKVLLAEDGTPIEPE